MASEEFMKERYSRDYTKGYTIFCSQCKEIIIFGMNIIKTWKGKTVCNKCYRKNINKSNIRNVRYD